MAPKVPARRCSIHHTQARTAATAVAAAVGYQAAAGSARHLASPTAATPANSAATPSCGSNPSAARPARPTSTQEAIPRTRPAGKATNATTRTAWCSDRAPTRNEPASHAGPTAAIKARSGSGPLAATPAATKASPTATSMAVNHGLAAGASLSARTASATSTPMARTPLAHIAPACGDLRKLATSTAESSHPSCASSTMTVGVAEEGRPYQSATRPNRRALAGRPTLPELQRQHTPVRRGRSAAVL